MSYNEPEMFDDAFDERDGASLLDAVRGIGSTGARGATINPLAASGVQNDDDGDNSESSESSDSDSDGDGADLGDDVLDVREKARKIIEARRGGEATAANKTNVDLNNAKNLADLEDPDLTERMRRARLTAAEHEEARNRLPRADDLKRVDTEARRALSALMSALKEQQMRIRCVCDEILLSATNVDRLAAGDQPHGYPSTKDIAVTPVMKKCMDHLRKKIKGSGSELESIKEALDEFERNLTVTRRNYETVVDGLRVRDEYYEGRAAEKPTGKCRTAE